MEELHSTFKWDDSKGTNPFYFFSNFPGLIDDRVWAEGLLVFYEVFAFLEGAIQRQIDTPVGKFDHPSLKRIPGFEADLSMFYGADWKRTHRPKDRECVRQVIAHLEEIEKTDPVLLIAYIYHLYLGLLSGGQILRKKQRLMRPSQFAQQSSVVDFDPKEVPELKKFIKNTMDDVAATMSDDSKKQILDESVKVFQFNCELIRSVRSTNEALLKIGRSVAFAAIFAVLAILFYMSLSSTEEDEKQL